MHEAALYNDILQLGQRDYLSNGCRTVSGKHTHVLMEDQMHLITEVLRYTALSVAVFLLIGLVEGIVWVAIVTLLRAGHRAVKGGGR